MTATHIAGKFARFYIGGVEVANMEEATEKGTLTVDEIKEWGSSGVKRLPLDFDFEVSGKLNIYPGVTAFSGSLAASLAGTALHMILYESTGVRIVEADMYVMDADRGMSRTSRQTQSFTLKPVNSTAAGTYYYGTTFAGTE